MSKKATNIQTAPSIPAAMARLVGSYLGVLALGVTFAAGTLQGVNQSTALLRAVAMGVTLYLCGRIIGWFLGRSLAAMNPGESIIGISETESTKA